MSMTGWQQVATTLGAAALTGLAVVFGVIWNTRHELKSEPIVAAREDLLEAIPLTPMKRRRSLAENLVLNLVPT
jgi:hypothetical protein